MLTAVCPDKRRAFRDLQLSGVHLPPPGAASFSVAAIQAHRSALHRGRHAHGNRLTVGIVAMFVEEERRAISGDMVALAVAKGTR
jgi:hypothetical protein